MENKKEQEILKNYEPTLSDVLHNFADDNIDIQEAHNAIIADIQFLLQKQKERMIEEAGGQIQTQKYTPFDDDFNQNQDVWARGEDRMAGYVAIHHNKALDIAMDIFAAQNATKQI